MIGSGGAARVLHLPQLRRDPRVELVWCADVDAACAAGTAAQFGVPHSGADYEHLLDEHPVDAVSICTPHSEHYPAGMAALRRGVHVCCEKPLGLSVGEAEALAKAAEAAGVQGMVHYVYRFSPAARLLKELIEQGELGEIVQVHGLYAQSIALSGAPMGWRFQKAMAGSGALGDLGSHMVDLARWWVGDVRRLCAQLVTVIPERRCPRTGALVPVDVDDVCFLTGEFASGALLQLTASRVMAGHKNDQRIEVSGTRGAAVYFNKSRTLRVCVGREFAESALWQRLSLPRRLAGKALRQAGRAVWVQAAPSSRRRMRPIIHFLDAIEIGQPPEASFREGAQVQAVLAAAQRSAAAGAWVSVGEPTPASTPVASLKR